MRLSRIEISGFRGVRDPIDLRLPSGFTVISGRNGSGKSTFCDAIEYVLTGDIRRESDYSENRESYEDYITWCGKGEPEGGTYVKLYIRDDDGQEIVVTRRPDEGIEVRPGIGGDGAPDGALNEPETALISRLCLRNQAPEKPLRRLCETSIIRDERITDLSVEAGERDRYKFVRRALGTSVFADSIDRARNLRDELRERADELENKLDKHDTEVSRLKSEIESAREKADNIDSVEKSADFVRSQLVDAGRLDEDEEISTTELATRARKLTVDLREDANELAHALSDYNDLRERIAKYREGGEAAQQLQEIDAELETVQDDIEEAQSRKEALETELKNFREQQPDTADLAELHRLGKEIGLTDDGECPLCGESHTPDEFDARLRRLRSRVDEVAEQIDERNERIDQQSTKLDELRNREKELRRKRSDLQDQRGTLISQLRAVRKRVDEVLSSSDVEEERPTSLDPGESDRDSEEDFPDLDPDELEQEIEERRRLRTQLDEKVSDVEASLALEEIDDLESQLGDEQQQLEETKDRLRRTNARADQADKVRKRVEEEEGQVHKDRIRKLSPLLAELYLRLRPHVDWKSLEPKVRGDIQLYLRFDVDGKNPSLFFSSGQRRAVGLAFLIAVHLGCTWSRLNTLVLDDPVQHIDDFRALQLTEVLSSIRRSGRQMIVTVEDEALARLLRRRLRSSEVQNGKHVQMAYDSRSGARIDEEHEIGPMPEQILAGLK